MRLRFNGLDILAICIAISLIWFPLLAGSVDSAALIRSASAVKNAGDPAVNNQATGNDYLVILGVVIAFVNLCVIAFQSWIFRRQTELMEGQLKATETAANAALAALDRPWVIIEVLGHNEVEWLEGNAPLFVDFQVANFGKAPAFIKSLRIVHFRGKNERMGKPPFDMPAHYPDFPGPDQFPSFIYRRGGVPMIRSKREMPLSHSPQEFVIPGGEKTEVFCMIGHAKREGKITMSGPIYFTQSFFAGTIYYEFPGQRSEILTFCYTKEMYGRFALFRDYAPYNHRKDTSGGE